MANKKRLIDAKPLMENGWHLVKTGESNRFLAQMSLADVPTVDAVEVVRCEDCKHKRQYHQKLPRCYCLLHEKYTLYDDFCSYGERKDNERKAD